MKSYLILPMGGVGQRFLDKGYSIYKPFLKIGTKNTIFDNIIRNFSSSDLEIIIIGRLNFLRTLYNKHLKKGKIHIIDIQNHDLGPIYSIFLASKKIKDIVKKNENIFVCYSDINWIWNFKKVKNSIKDKNIVVFTHTGFHPHLQTNPRSDYCKIKKKFVFDIKEKKNFSKDYKNDHLAVGCYYFKNYELIENFFKKSINIFKNKKEIYFVSIIKFYLKLNKKINFLNINHFVHLGTPDQYEDFLNWREIIKFKFKKRINLKSPCIMLMAGEGNRVANLNKKKPFLEIGGYQIFDFVFKKFVSSKRIVISNKENLRGINNKKHVIYKVEKTKSMIQTLEKSMVFLKKFRNYLLTSCDCYGEFKSGLFFRKLKSTKSDIIIFGYQPSILQKSLNGSHTTLNIKFKKLIDIFVKKKDMKDNLGHAGFFWIKNSNVFNYLEKFKKSIYFKNLYREPIIDDYFKFLLKNKFAKVNYFKIENYVHIGSPLEYYEFNYWDKYFINENSKNN